MDIAGSIALVTGANRGLGKAFAEALVERGATVYAGARDPASVTSPGLTAVRLDVTDPASVAAAAEQIGDATLVINNAGLIQRDSVVTGSLDDVRSTFETNVLGPLQVTQAFAPVLARNGGGALVNMLSVRSWQTTPRSAAYAASKAALWSLTNAIRAELREQGTLVVGVHVGLLDTDLVASIDEPKLAPADLAQQVLDAVEADQDEVLGDELTRQVKASLVGPPSALVS